MRALTSSISSGLIGIISSRAELNVRAVPFGGKERVCSYRSYRVNSYFQGLPKDAWDSYEQRLILNGLSLEENYYSPNGSANWSADTAQLRSVDGDIFSYFVSP